MASPDATLQPKQTLPYVVCVEGNIGSGKSTLLKNLKKHGFTVIEEPVTDIWGQYLPQLYEDIERWGFCFQMEAMDWFRQLQSRKFAQILIRMKQNPSINSTPQKSPQQQVLGGGEDDDVMMGPDQFETDSEQKQQSVDCPTWTPSDSEDLDEHQENETVPSQFLSPPPRKHKKQRRASMSPQKQLLESQWQSQAKRIIIVERSALSCITIFAKNLMEADKMSQWEFSLLKRFYSMIAWEPAHILYLRVDPEVCCRRISKRNRKGEEDVDPDLIRGLHEKHEFAFVRPKETRSRRDSLDGMVASSRQNVIIVDGINDADTVIKEALIKISRIESKM